MTDVTVAVIHYSATGSVFTMAEAAAKAAEAAGADVRLRKVHELAPEEAIRSNDAWYAHRERTSTIAEATLDDLEWADVIMFGTPTRFGLPAAQLKQFIDSAGGLWGAGKLIDKVGTSFTSVATAHGGHETTLTAINNVFYHWGAIIVGPGYADPIQFASGNPYGTSHTSDNGTTPPGDVELQAISFQTTRAVRIARALTTTRAAPDPDQPGG